MYSGCGTKPAIPSSTVMVRQPNNIGHPMKCYDKLQICFDASLDTFHKLTTILGVQPSEHLADFPDGIPCCWTHEVIDDQPNTYFDFINVFLDLLETKYHDLEQLNIRRENISVWMSYEYDQQCNMEFDPVRLKRLGDNGITLCISCWDSGKPYGSKGE
jgi:hypothetical protein